MSLHDDVLERLTGYGARLHSFDDGTVSLIRKMLEDLEASLVEQFRLADPTAIARRTHRLARLEAILAQTRATIDGTYAELGSTLRSRLEEVAGFSIEFTHGTLVTMLGPVRTAVGINTVTVSPELLRRLADDTLISMGGRTGAAPVKEWLATQKDDVVKAFAGQMREGLMRGEGIPELARRISGGGRHDGIGPISREWAEALARTANTAVTAEAREDVYAANSAVVKGIFHVTTRDERTCFAAGTLVRLSDASVKPIEEIVPGDTIISGCGRPRSVRGVLERVAADWRTIAIAGGELVHCTATHPFWTARGWREAEAFKPGDVIAVGTVSGLRRDAAREAEGTARGTTRTSAPLLLAAMPGEGQEKHPGDRTLRGLRKRLSVLPQYAAPLLLASLLPRGQGQHAAEADVRGVRSPVQGEGLTRQEGGGSVAEVLQPGVHTQGAGLPTATGEGLRAVRRRLFGRGPANRKGEVLLARLQAWAADRATLPLLRRIVFACPGAGSGLLLGRVLQKECRRNPHGNDGEARARGDGPALRARGQGGSLLHRLRRLRLAGCRTRRDLLAPQSPGSEEGRGGESGGLHASEDHPRHGDRRVAPSCSASTVPRPCGWAEVVAIESDQTPALCYDLEIEGDHSFLVGHAGLIAHNTIVCLAYAGKAFVRDADGFYQPLGHKLPYNGGVPRHVRCRSVEAPMVRSLKELGLSESEVPPELRSAFGAMPPAEQQGEAILAGLKKSQQLKVLGRRRYDLWKRGDVGLAQMISPDGQVLRLDEIAAAATS